MRVHPALFCAALLLTLTAVARADDPKPAPEGPKLEYLFLEFTGVAEGKAPLVARGVEGVAGVQSFTWTTDGVEGKVVREVGKAPDSALLEAARAAGAATAGVVPIAVTTFTFEKKLHCGGCIASVEKTVRAIHGVKDVSVPEAMTTVSVVYDTRSVKPGDVEAALAAIKKPAKTS